MVVLDTADKSSSGAKEHSNHNEKERIPDDESNIKKGKALCYFQLKTNIITE